jgi:hypothetical protein
LVWRHVRSSGIDNELLETDTFICFPWLSSYRTGFLKSLDQVVKTPLDIEWAAIVPSVEGMILLCWKSNVSDLAVDTVYPRRERRHIKPCRPHVSLFDDEDI